MVRLHRRDEAMPRRGRVSTKRGLSASSPSASRSFLIAVLRLCSKSMKVLAGQSRKAGQGEGTRAHPTHSSCEDGEVSFPRPASEISSGQLPKKKWPGVRQMRTWNQVGAVGTRGPARPSAVGGEFFLEGVLPRGNKLAPNFPCFPDGGNIRRRLKIQQT